MPTQQQEIEFGDLLNRNCQTINSICLRYCGGNALYFDELRQKCAVAIWAESTWIYQISYHAVIDYHLSQTIKKSMERTVMDWIDEYTLLLIRHLLSTTEDSQESIAEDTHLEKTTSLIRFFKKKTGEPPHEYRSMKK